MISSVFPVEFLLSTILLGVLLILFVFLTPRALGFILTKLLSLILRNGPYIKVGTLYEKKHHTFISLPLLPRPQA